MFNPLVDSFDDLTNAQIDESIRDLSKKYFQSRNPQVQQQISTILEMYKQEARTRSAKEMQRIKDEQNGESGLDNLINIS
jgi:metal-responsive CopG/Arc/MetJ family transcriptional regulator